MAEPEPWEQQDGESAAAFSAFRAYRDLGPGRSVVEAYRQSACKPDAKQADGTWNGWVSRFSWQERCAAYDRRLDAEHVEGVAKGMRTEGEKWARRAQAQAEREYRMGLLLQRKARRLARFPVTRRTRDVEGRTVTVEPVDAIGLRRAAAVAMAGAELTRAAINAGIGREQEQAAPAPLVLDPSTLAAAAQKLSEWRASMLPTQPPPGVEVPTPQGDSHLPQWTGWHAGGGGGPQDTRAAPVKRIPGEGPAGVVSAWRYAFEEFIKSVGLRSWGGLGKKYSRKNPGFGGRSVGGTWATLASPSRVFGGCAKFCTTFSRLPALPGGHVPGLQRFRRFLRKRFAGARPAVCLNPCVARPGRHLGGGRGSQVRGGVVRVMTDDRAPRMYGLCRHFGKVPPGPRRPFDQSEAR